MTKVVEFPKSKIVREIPIETEELKNAKERSTKNFADTIVMEISHAVLDELENYGIDTDSEAFMKDFSFTIDGLRATVYRTVNLPHHLHSFIDNNVEVKKLEDIKMMVDEVDMEEDEIVVDLLEDEDEQK